MKPNFNSLKMCTAYTLNLCLGANAQSSFGKRSENFAPGKLQDQTDHFENDAQNGLRVTAEQHTAIFKFFLSPKFTSQAVGHCFSGEIIPHSTLRHFLMFPFCTASISNCSYQVVFAKPESDRIRY